MGQFIVPAPTLGESLELFFDERGNKVASKLINFIPTETSIYLRKGYSKFFNLELEDDEVVDIFTYEAKSSLVLFTKKTIYAVRNNLAAEIKYNNPLGSSTSSLQTNDRLIVFFSSRAPLVFFFDDKSLEWKVEDLELENANTQILTGAIKYRERLFFYSKGINTIYYLEPLSYKGKLTSYELSGRFGAKGTLVFLGTIGFNAGASVMSLMYAVFDTGDILTFNGINPESENWRVEQKVSTGMKIDSGINVFTDSLLLGKEGIYSLTEILKNNAVSGADIFGAKIKSRLKELQKGGALKMCFLSGFLYLISPKKSNHFGINISTLAVFELQGMEINHFAILDDKLLFLDNTGHIFVAFSGESDNGEEINGVWESTFLFVPGLIPFRTTKAVIDCYVEGDYYLTYYQKVNVGSQLLKRCRVHFNNGEVRWSELQGKDWIWVENALWAHYGAVKYKNISISAGSHTKKYGFKIEVSSSLSSNFSLNQVVVNFI